VEPAPIEPVDVGQRRPLDVLDALPRSFVEDELGLVEPDEGLGEGIVIRVAARADRVDGVHFAEPLGVADCEVLHAPVAVMDQAAESTGTS